MKERALNMELLRIIAMIMVVIVHINFGAIGVPNTEEYQCLSSEALIQLTIEVFCIICTNIFVLISGWYGIRFSAKGLLKFIFQVFFWNFIAYLIFIFLGNNFSISHIKSLLCLDGKLWFVISYIFLYVISPILNAFIDSTDKKNFKKVLLAVLVFQTLVGWISKIGYFVDGYSPMSFISLYLLARYVNRYPNKYFTLPLAIDLILYIGLCLIIIISVIVSAMCGETIEGLYSYISPFVIAASLFFVLAFSKMPIHKAKHIILYFSPSVFAVYLFHENPFIHKYFYAIINNIYNNYRIIELIGCVLLLFIAVTTIDKLRILIWKSITSSKNKVYQP